MSGLTSKLYNTYVHLMVWLGAAPPPGYEHLLPDETGNREYILKEGETIFSVARKFGVHHERIAQANAITDPNTVLPGQILVIPPAEGEPSAGSVTQVAEIESEPAAPAVAPQRPQPPAAQVEPTSASFSTKESPWLTEEVEASIPAEEPSLFFEEEETAAETESFTEPEWLLALEPAPQPETTETAPPTEFSFSDRLEWLTTNETRTTAPEATEATPPAEVTPRPVEGEEMTFRYTVQRGDTLTAIAKRYAVTMVDLIEANDIADPSHIFPGQKLVIPGYMSPKPPRQPETKPELPPPTPDEFFVYTVVEGDTLSSIARRYGLALDDLATANHLREPYPLRVGQRLFIPGIMQPPEVKPETLPQPGGPSQVTSAAWPQPQPEAEVKSSSMPETRARPITRIDPAFPPLGPLEAIRALYVSYFAIGHPESRQHIFNLLDTTEFNAVVIDAKGDYGWLSYPTQIPLAHDIGAARPTAKDFSEVMAQFKARGVYTIARIVAFKDSTLAKSRPDLAVKIENSGDIWTDRENLHWSDPFLKPVWDYNVEIAVEAAENGFDEIQFDCLRFPTPSQAGAPGFSQEVTKDSRVAAVTGFLSVARGQLKPFGVKVAAATFGYTCWRKDDTLIGQDIERMGPYLDVLSPMLYPSTFGSGIPGHKFAIAYPYEVVFESAKQAVERVSQLGCQVRPWIQDFQDYRFDQRIYGKDDIRAQIKGCFDAGGGGFMVWDPNGKFTTDAYAHVGRD